MADPGSRRARAMFWARLVASLCLIAVLVHKAPDLGSVLPEHHPGRTALLLALAAAVALGGVVVSAWRWQRVLALFDAHVSLLVLFRYYLASLFVGNLLPSTIGGDVVRVARAAPDAGGTDIAFASVALERLTGFVALPLLVFVGFTLQPSLVDVDHAWIALLIAGATLALLAAILFLAGHPRVAGRYASHTNWMRFLGAIHRGVNALRRDPQQAMVALLAAVAYQTMVVLSVVLIATALDIGAPTAALIAFVPAVAMVQVLPLSLNGLGVREGLLVTLLHPLGVSRGDAVALGLLWYATMLVVSALGAPAFAASRRNQTMPATDDSPR